MTMPAGGPAPSRWVIAVPAAERKIAMIRIALAQINTTVGDLEGNAGLILESAKRAEESGASIVAFPELTISGYPPEDLLLRRQFITDCEETLTGLARDSGDIAMVIGLPRMAQGRLHNAAAILQGGTVRGYYHKINLPNYGVFDEKRYFAAGDRSVLLEIGDKRIGLHICEDSWEVDREPTPSLARSRVDAVLNLSASPFNRGKYEDRRRTLGEVARRCGAPLLYVNLVGGQDEVVFDGGSVFLASDGTIERRAKRFGEDLMLVDLDDGAGHDAGGSGGGENAADRAVDVVRLDRVDAALSSGAPGALDPPPDGGAELSLEEEIYSAVVLGTSDYLRKNNFSKAVIGLSGGIDSALVAAIACDALGRENVTGVTMPSRFTSKETRGDAEKLAVNLGIDFLELPIEKAVLAMGEALAESFAGTEEGIAEENIQARVRGNLLMALSNKFGWIVLNTGNKSETAVGYSTLYGDMVGGLAVIGDVPKTMVYRLARWRNDQPGGTVIPESTIARPPSAELRADQKDSDSLPGYDQLDAILEAYVEQDLDTETIAKNLGDAGTVRRILRLVNRAEFKRRQAPPIIKITPKSFGRDRRFPITNRYRHRDG